MKSLMREEVNGCQWKEEERRREIYQKAKKKKTEKYHGGDIDGTRATQPLRSIKGQEMSTVE